MFTKISQVFSSSSLAWTPSRWLTSGTVNDDSEADFDAKNNHKSCRTVSFDVPPQEILTKDSVTVAVDAVVYYKVSSPALTLHVTHHPAHNHLNPADHEPDVRGVQHHQCLSVNPFIGKHHSQVRFSSYFFLNFSSDQRFCLCDHFEQMLSQECIGIFTIFLSIFSSDQRSCHRNALGTKTLQEILSDREATALVK